MFSPAAILLLPTLLAAAVLAAPSPQAPPPACSTAYPIVRRVSQAQPHETNLPGFTVSQDAGATNKQDVFIEFDLPAGVHGCQLETYFPAGYPITSSGQTQVYVYSTDHPLPRYPGSGIVVSWDQSPAAVSQVGTVQFESDPSQPTKRVVNSFVCADRLTYRLSIGRDYTAAGSVSFDQSNQAGLRLTYNC